MIDKRVYYAVVAVRDELGCQIIAEYPADVDPSCREMVLSEIDELTATKEIKSSVDRDECTVHVLADELYYACLTCKADCPSSASQLRSCSDFFLERLKTVYKELPILTGLSKNFANLINIDLSNPLKKIVDEYNDGDSPDQSTNENNQIISRLEEDLTEIRDLLMDSVQKLMDRGQKLDDLLEKTQSLQDTSQKNFHIMTRASPRKRNILVVTGAAVLMCLSTSLFVVLLYAGIL